MGGSDVLGVLIGVLVIGSAIWVGFDAQRLGAKAGVLGGGLVDMGPAGWFIVVLMLWIVGFPVYLATRPSYVALRTGGIAPPKPNDAPTSPSGDGPQDLPCPEDIPQPLVDAPILQTWKTQVGFSVLGLLLGFPLLLVFSALLVDLLTRSDAELPLLRVIVALILMSIYAATFYPSYFTKKPLLKSNRAISFANIMFGLWAGFGWNDNLTKKTKGTSNVRFIVGNALVCALLAFATFGALRFGALSNSRRTPDSPPYVWVAPSVIVTPTPLAFAPPANWNVEPLKRTGDAKIYTDAETGASFVIPDTWSEQQLLVDKSWQAKFGVPGDAFAFYGSVDDRVLRMDDALARLMYESMKSTMPNATVKRTALNGVEYFVGSGSAAETQSGLVFYGVRLIRIENGRVYDFKYVGAAGDSRDEHLQTFFSMVASMDYP